MNVRQVVRGDNGVREIGIAQPTSADRLADVRATMKVASAKLTSFGMSMISPMGFSSFANRRRQATENGTTPWKKQLAAVVAGAFVMPGAPTP